VYYWAKPLIISLYEYLREMVPYLISKLCYNIKVISIKVYYWAKPLTISICKTGYNFMCNMQDKLIIFINTTLYDIIKETKIFYQSLKIKQYIVVVTEYVTNLINVCKVLMYSVSSPIIEFMSNMINSAPKVLFTINQYVSNVVHVAIEYSKYAISVFL